MLKLKEFEIRITAALGISDRHLRSLKDGYVKVFSE